jgi:D-alanine-D-alanine ligase
MNAKNSLTRKRYFQVKTTPRPSYRVALIANLKDNFQPKEDDPPDAGAEFDKLETIHEITQALESEGHSVFYCSADRRLPQTLINLQPQICFNIAEGLHGDGREAQVPALCELLGIPYTASRVVAHAISLDKTQTKRIWQQQGLPTAPFYQFSSLAEIAHTHLSYPLFVKPAREGTGMGIDNKSIANNHQELVERVAWTLQHYQQPALVEEFLPGREYTVGFLGNHGNPGARSRQHLYDSDGYHWFPILEIDTLSSVSPQVYGHESKSIEIGVQGAPRYLCPADIPVSLRARLIDLSKRAAEALDVKDVSRIDFRMGADGEPYLMEINTLPGLNPKISDLCIMAASEQMQYQTLISEILYLAAQRFGLETGNSASFTKKQPKRQKMQKAAI